MCCFFQLTNIANGTAVVEKMYDVRGKRCQAEGCFRQPGFGHPVRQAGLHPGHHLSEPLVCCVLLWCAVLRCAVLCCAVQTEACRATPSATNLRETHLFDGLFLTNHVTLMVHNFVRNTGWQPMRAPVVFSAASTIPRGRGRLLGYSSLPYPLSEEDADAEMIVGI